MRTQLSTYEKSFWDKQAVLLAKTFPRLNELAGMSRITSWLFNYLKKYPCENNSSQKIGRYFPKFLRQHEDLRELSHWAELARFEWSVQMAITKTQLLSSLYPVHLKRESEYKIKSKTLNYYALQYRDNKVQTHILTEFEFRMLHWIAADSKFDSILKKAALFGYNENQVHSLTSTLQQRSLLEHKLHYIQTS